VKWNVKKGRIYCKMSQFGRNISGGGRGRRGKEGRRRISSYFIFYKIFRSWKLSKTHSVHMRSRKKRG
jgi:hypothetical protein